MFIGNVSILAVRPHHWHHPVFEYPICWSFDFVLVLLFTTYYFDKSSYCFWHQKCLSDAGANYSHSVTCIGIIYSKIKSKAFIKKSLPFIFPKSYDTLLNQSQYPYLHCL